MLLNTLKKYFKTFNLTLLPHTAGLAKSLARRPGAIVLSSRATKMIHRPARRDTLKYRAPMQCSSKLCARAKK